jgi:glycosyltransferase involved in cell wall biosynthesis
MTRIAVLPDFVEERWPSMDLCADQLLAHAPPGILLARCCPPWQRRFERLPVFGRKSAAFNADRLWNRFRNYPRFARSIANSFDAFHIVDHTYAQLANHLPPARTGVFCHDLDAFRCLIQPEQEPRPKWFRRFAQRILDGLQRTAVVFYTTEHTRSELLRFQLVKAERLVQVPLGVASEFTAIPTGHRPPWLAALAGHDWVLHVGSCIPRKRIDVLLDVVAALRTLRPKLRLLKIGGTFTPTQEQQLDTLNLRGVLHHVTGVSREDLAAAYRAAPLVLMTSEAEGFGLPAAEALACGTPVLASDIPPLREAGGAAAHYAPVGDVAAWVSAARALLETPGPAAPRRAHAAQFSWTEHAQIVSRTYERLVAGFAGPA